MRRPSPRASFRSGSRPDPWAVRRVGDHVTLDVGRALRTGIPEVVVAEGKTALNVREAALGLARAHGQALVTRVHRSVPWGRIPGFVVEHYREAHAVVLRRRGSPRPNHGGRVAVLTGGVSDRHVAAEVEVVARELGSAVRLERDVGVAGLARLLAALERLRPWSPDAYVVLAGREGALAPVTAGLVEAPVIGVPVSTGYGRGGKGEAALLTMLQSCAPLVTVNIDAGFVAGAVAAQIANRAGRLRRALSRTARPQFLK